MTARYNCFSAFVLPMSKIILSFLFFIMLNWDNYVAILINNNQLNINKKYNTPTQQNSVSTKLHQRMKFNVQELMRAVFD